MTNSQLVSKSADAFRTISEVADALKLPQHVLRFWETRFVQIKPLKRGGGRRFYRPEDVELLMAIRQLLYGDGYTIKGVQRLLKEQGPRGVASLAQRRSGRSEGPQPLRPVVSTAEPERPSRAPLAIRPEPTGLEPGAPSAKGPDDGDHLSWLNGLGDAPGTAAGPSSQPDPLADAVTQNDHGRSMRPLAQLRSVLLELGECRRILDAAGDVRRKPSEAR